MHVRKHKTILPVFISFISYRSFESASKALDHIDSCLSKTIETGTEDCGSKSKKSKRQNSLYQGVAFEAWINNHIYPLFEVKCNKEEKQLFALFQCVPEDLYPNQEACLKNLIVSIEKDGTNNSKKTFIQ